MKKITPKNLKIYSFLLLSFLILSLVSCSTSQNTTGNDGIYGEETYYPDHNNQEVAVIKDRQSSEIYQNYFETESKKYDFDEDDIITDVDDYEGYDETEGNVTVNNYYVDGTPPWDYSSDVSVSFHFGIGGYYGGPCGGYYGGYWGYPYYGYGYGCGYGGYWGGYWGGYYPWYGGGYYSPYYPYYPGYYPPYYPGYPGYRPPYYGGDYTYGKRSTYNTRPWARNSTAYNYQRTSSTGKRGSSTNIYSKAARESSTRATNYQRNSRTSSSTRNYNRSTTSNKTNTRSYNRSSRSSSPSYNRSNSTMQRSSSPSMSRGSSGVRSGGVSRGRHQASVNSSSRSNNYNTSRAYADRRKVTRVGNVNYNPNKYIRNNRTKYTSTAGKTSNTYRTRSSGTGTSKYTTQRYVSKAKKSTSVPRRSYTSTPKVKNVKSSSYKKSYSTNSNKSSYSRSSSPSSARSSSYSRSSGSSSGGSRSSGRRSR